MKKFLSLFLFLFGSACLEGPATEGSTGGSTGDFTQSELLSIESLSIAPSEMTLAVGESASASLSVLLSSSQIIQNITSAFEEENLSGTVSWYVYDETVASVSDEGVVTANKAGYTKIKADLLGKSVLLEVVVHNPPEEEKEEEEGGTSGSTGEASGSGEVSEEIQSLEILNNISSWEVGDEIKLKVKLTFNTGTVTVRGTNSFTTPEGKEAKLSWSSSDRRLATVTNGVATLKAYGDVTLKVSYEGKTSSLEAFVFMKPENADWDDQFLGEDEIFEITYGYNSGYGKEHFPENFYGAPVEGGTHTVSMGAGGELVIELGTYALVDGPGVDFVIYENPVYSYTYGNFLEPAKIGVSEDGENFTFFSCLKTSPYTGCAGVIAWTEENPIDPDVAGGDQYDLNDLGFSKINFIKIIDLDLCRDGEEACGVDGTWGFDLDSIALINGEYK